jgi:DNA-binding HxlR family transcriptional regulator
VTRSAPSAAPARAAGGRHSPAPAEAAVVKGLAPAGAARPGGESFCPVAEAASLLGDTWTLLLLRELGGGPRRFKELEASTGISPRVLTDRLRALCERGMMTRRMYAEIPPRVEYELTEKGRDALPVLDALRAFGEKWLRPQPEGKSP